MKGEIALFEIPTVQKIDLFCGTLQFAFNCDCCDEIYGQYYELSARFECVGAL